MILSIITGILVVCFLDYTHTHTFIHTHTHPYTHTWAHNVLKVVMKKEIESMTRKTRQNIE